MSRISRARGLWVTLLLLSSLTPALAHTRSESQSSWRAAGQQLVGVFQVDAHRVTQIARAPEDLGDLFALFVRHLDVHVRARQDNKACASQSTRRLASDVGQLRSELVFICPADVESSAVEIENTAFRSVSPMHVHYARIEQPGHAVHEVVLAGAKTTLQIGGPAKAAPETFGAFLWIGLEHVLSGLDHLAFLLALVLLAGRPRSAALAATGFTIGHSVTLGLVAFGWLRPHTAAIEALIGFTIAFTAALAWREQKTGSAARAACLIGFSAAVAMLPFATQLLGQSTPPWPIYFGAALFAVGFGMRGAAKGTSPTLGMLLAMAFGLVHGAGFAGGLLDLELPKDRLLGALIGFNVGVEVAQIIVLGVCGAGAVAARTLPQAWPVLGREVASAALIGLGAYWFAARSLL